MWSLQRGMKNRRNPVGAQKPNPRLAEPEAWRYLALKASGTWGPSWPGVDAYRGRHQAHPGEGSRELTPECVRDFLLGFRMCLSLAEQNSQCPSDPCHSLSSVSAPAGLERWSQGDTGMGRRESILVRLLKQVFSGQRQRRTSERCAPTRLQESKHPCSEASAGAHGGDMGALPGPQRGPRRRPATSAWR